MTDDVPVTELFEDVEADPDAIIAAYGADSPEDLVDGPGEHDPHPDPVLDGDVDGAAERLTELADLTLDSTSDGHGPRDDPTDSATDTGPSIGTATQTDTDTDGPRYTADSVGGGVTVDVLPGDGESLGEFLGLDDTQEASTVTDREPVLVGPEPAATRVSNESFGPAAHPPTADGPGAGPSTWRRTDNRPDPTQIDADAATERETELASSVFEWVS